MDGPYEGNIKDRHKDLFLVSMKEGKTIMVNFNFSCFLCRIGTPIAVTIFQSYHIQQNPNTLNKI